jgi:putative aldouronate transport system permease protein
MKAAKRRAFKRSGIFYLMLLPALLWMICFRILPLPGVVIAFQDFNIYDGFFGSVWVGFKHFENFFTHPQFLKVLRNTFEISVLKIIVLFPIPVLLALLLNEFRSTRWKRVAQTVIYMPHFLSFVVIHGIFVSFLSTQGGMVNGVIQFLGGGAVNFYANDMFRFTLLLTEGFKESGWNTIVYLAALSAIDTQLYEAAEVDGASRFQQMLTVTLPSLLPTVMLMLTLRLAAILQAGTIQILVMYNPTVYESADVIGTFVYREGVGNGKFSLATAVGLFESLVGFVTIIGANTFCSRDFKRGLW